MLGKVVLLLTVFGCVLCSEEHKSFILDLTKHIRDKCLKQTSVDVALVDKWNQGDFSDDRTLKCYMNCIFEKLYVYLPDDTIKVENLVGSYPPKQRDTYADMIRSCGGIKGADRCETAFLTHKCYHEKYPNLHFLM